MTEDKRHELNELSVSDVMSYLSARVFAMEEHARKESKQLSKAKSLMRELYSIIQVECSPFTREEHKNILSEAEQFLQE